MFLTTVRWMDGAEDFWKTPYRPKEGTDGVLRMYLRKTNYNMESPMVAVPLANVRSFTVIEEG